MKHLHFLLLAAGLSLQVATAQVDDVSSKALFKFYDPDVTAVEVRDWGINIKPDEKTGERGTASFEPNLDPDRGHVARLTSKDTPKITLASPEISLPPNRTPTGIHVEYRTAPNSSPVAFMASDGVNTSKVFLPSGTGNWEKQIIMKFPLGKNGDEPPLDLAKLRRIFFSSRGDVDLSIASVKLLYGEKQVSLTAFTRPLTVVPDEKAAPELDGKLDDGVWKNAAVISGLFDTTEGRNPEKYPTEIRVLRNGSKLWLGVKLGGEAEPSVGHSNGGQSVWKDSSVEVLLVPGDGDGDKFQMAVNARNDRESMTTKSRGKEWGGAWKSAVSREKDGWTLEMEINVADLDPSWNDQAIWRWNFVRNVSTAEKSVASRTGLYGVTKSDPVAALLAFATVEPRPDAKGFGMLKTGPTEYTLLLPSPPKENPGTVRIYKSATGGKDAWMQTVPIAPNAAAAKLELKDPGLYRLEVEQRDSGKPTQVSFLEVIATVPIQTQWDDIVLWPTPQKLELGKDSLPLARIASIEQQGDGDGSPVAHLSEELQQRYGQLDKRGSEKTHAITLLYDKNAKIPDEGYRLAVGADGVKITAATGSGMYYGVRTLLDLIEQSTLDLSRPQIRHVQIEDWPQVGKRVFYFPVVGGYKGPYDMKAVKQFLYKEVAGGRYNLLILVASSRYKYASAPEVADSRAWSREQWEEVIAFARRNYMDVAPGGWSPGHANWLTSSHPEFGDGSDKALDLTNPEVMKKLLTCYDELLEVFKPRYFHLGVDEWRPNMENGKSPEELRALFLAHLKQLHEHFKAKGVQTIVWDDMLSPKWNGGPPKETAKILKDLPRDMIMSSWGVEHFVNSPSVYSDLGFGQVWSVLTGFGPERADRTMEWYKDYNAVGLGIYVKYPWMVFANTGNFGTATPYTAGAIHLNALVGWNPQTLTRGAVSIMRNEGAHWMRTMSPPDLGRTDIHVAPVPLANLSAQTPPELLKPVLEAFSGASIGQPPYQFKTTPGQAVFAATAKDAPSIPVDKKVAGLFFLHTAQAAKDDFRKLGQALLQENTNPFGLEIGAYEIQYADGSVERIPIVLGYNIQIFHAPVEAAILEGSPSYLTGKAGRDSVSAWVLNWKNSRPDVPVKSVRVLSSNKDAPIALLGLNAAEIDAPAAD